MAGFISQVINYYGVLHLVYYSSQQFFLFMGKESASPDAKKENDDNEKGLIEGRKYEALRLWLSKW